MGFLDKSAASFFTVLKGEHPLYDNPQQTAEYPRET